MSKGDEPTQAYGEGPKSSSWFSKFPFLNKKRLLVGVSLVLIFGLGFWLVSALFGPSVAEESLIKVVEIRADSSRTKLFSLKKGDLLRISAVGKWSPGEDEGYFPSFGPEGYPGEEPEREFPLLEDFELVTTRRSFAGLIGKFEDGNGGDWLLVGRDWGPMEYRDNGGSFMVRMNYKAGLLGGSKGFGSLLVVARRTRGGQDEGPEVDLGQPEEREEGVFSFPVSFQDSKGLKKVIIDGSVVSLEGEVRYREQVEVIQGSGEKKIKLKAINEGNKATRLVLLFEGRVVERLRKNFDQVSLFGQD